MPLTACAPLAVAKEKGFFTKHGLDEVTLVRESNWRGITDGITGGYLDAAQMPSGMPLWLTLGGHENRPVPIVTSLTMTRNGNAITLAKRFYDQGVYSLSDFKEMLHNTRKATIEWEWCIHPLCTICCCVTGWQLAVLTRSRR